MGGIPRLVQGRLYHVTATRNNVTAELIGVFNGRVKEDRKDEDKRKALWSFEIVASHPYQYTSPIKFYRVIFGGDHKIIPMDPDDLPLYMNWNITQAYKDILSGERVLRHHLTRRKCFR